MTSRRPYWCPKTMKRRPCWCPKPILWELKCFLMQTLSFVSINLHRCWPREWKHSIAQKKEPWFYRNVKRKRFTLLLGNKFIFCDQKAIGLGSKIYFFLLSRRVKWQLSWTQSVSFWFFAFSRPLKRHFTKRFDGLTRVN